MARQFINSKSQYNIYCHHLLLSVLIRVWLVSNENKNKFQILARTDNNGKSPEIRLSVLIIQVDRIANSNSIAALFQFKGSLCNDEHGQAYFWGFTIVILRVPDIFSDSIHALSSFGYEYRLSKTETPWSDRSKVMTVNIILSFAINKLSCHPLSGVNSNFQLSFPMVKS